METQMDCPPLPTIPNQLPLSNVTDREPELAVLQSILKNGGQHTQSGDTRTSSTIPSVSEIINSTGRKLRITPPCNANKDSITKGISYATEFERQRLNGFRDDAKAFFKSYYNTMREHNPTLYGQLTGPSYEVMLNEMDTWTGAVPTRDAEFYLVTVNPKPTVVLGQLMTFVEKMLNKKWIQDNNCYWLYAFEVRRAPHSPEFESKGPGLHVHIILERPLITGTSKRYPASAFKREILSTFTKIVGNGHAVDFRPITDGTLDTTIGYLLGFKNGDKQDAVDATEDFREYNDIDNFYERQGYDRTSAIIDLNYPDSSQTPPEERKEDSGSDTGSDSEDDSDNEETDDL